jgi:hypothetical protein
MRSMRSRACLMMVSGLRGEADQRNGYEQQSLPMPQDAVIMKIQGNDLLVSGTEDGKAQT